MAKAHGGEVQVLPLTVERWPDLERLFGPRGAAGGCWCMWWRLSGRAFARQKGEGNRQALHTLVTAGEVPGLLAYVDGAPAGWCALAPRQHYPRLERSRPLARVDAQPVWSVTCFFIAQAYRRRGIMSALLEAAKEFARAHGATLLEGYPVDPATADHSPAMAYTGLVSAFHRTGFVEVARRSPSRPVMRCALIPSATVEGSHPGAGGSGAMHPASAPRATEGHP
jgi:GNAT superfamily N-acetyltransferase